jgi:hypothetical protein
LQCNQWVEEFHSQPFRILFKEAIQLPLSQAFSLRGEEENPRRARCPCKGRSDFLGTPLAFSPEFFGVFIKLSVANFDTKSRKAGQKEH